MIAQKIVDAKQPPQPVGALVALTDSLATASRTFFIEHIRFNPPQGKADQVQSAGDVGITTGVY